MLLNIFTETMVMFFRIFLMNRKLKRTDLFGIEIFCNLRNDFTVNFDKFSASLMKN